MYIFLFEDLNSKNRSLSAELSYDNTNPYSTGCASKSPITYETEYIYKNGVKIGYVQLKGSAYCHTAWGYLKFYSSAPYDYYANVWGDSFNGTTKRAFTSCASSGGNGWIMKGQTSGNTAQLWNLDPYNALAKAGIYSSSGALMRTLVVINEVLMQTFC
ncbi:DUF2690 domain-containing protein [Peribacillus simplex]|uniref:DUF2690 domain-containing protein n=1 Tax=Peribacillus simplex TaxID=1478 RepID=UPI003337AE5F